MGSITHIVDKDKILNGYEYDAWGNVTNSTEMIENRFKFNGQQLDPITKQYYLRARYYNPVIARFTQEDTYRGDGLNLYTYCANNPVSYIDPTGFSSCDKKNPLDNIISIEDAARLAKDIYENLKDDYEFNEWKLIEKRVFKGSKVQNMAIFEKEGTIAIVNRGTKITSPRDWKENLIQPLGNSNDMKESLEEAVALVETYKTRNIIFIGHSKGGGETQMNALATDKPFITFNPVASAPDKYDLTRGKEYTNCGVNYIVNGGLLNFGNEHLLYKMGGNTRHIGEKIYIGEKTNFDKDKL